tara:strand:- start:5186 stop:5569 length:384 start_codon:yes stop_codon:yes gene_type:complete
MDLEVYRFTWQRVLGSMPPSLNVKYVYLRAPVGCLQDRKDRRARDGEGSIPLDYMHLLHTLHDEWLDTVPGDSHKTIIDATKTEDEIFNDVCLVIGEWIRDASSAHVRRRNMQKHEERDDTFVDAKR